MKAFSLRYSLPPVTDSPPAPEPTTLPVAARKSIAPGSLSLPAASRCRSLYPPTYPPTHPPTHPPPTHPPIAASTLSSLLLLHSLAPSGPFPVQPPCLPLISSRWRRRRHFAAAAERAVTSRPHYLVETVSFQTSAPPLHFSHLSTSPLFCPYPTQHLRAGSKGYRNQAADAPADSDSETPPPPPHRSKPQPLQCPARQPAWTRGGGVTATYACSLLRVGRRGAPAGKGETPEIMRLSRPSLTAARGRPPSEPIQHA